MLGRATAPCRSFDAVGFKKIAPEFVGVFGSGFLAGPEGFPYSGGFWPLLLNFRNSEPSV